MAEQRTFTYKPELRIWTTPSHPGLSYSDGEQVEQRLLSSLRQCRDVSAASVELQSHITDWPSEYHFSSARHNLLRPFNLSPSDRILELGCGCGAMTRYLGETGATVVAVEGSMRRAAIAAERCRDLPNVSVYCDNLTEFNHAGEFDFVTLIGVLEYAPLFIKAENPVGTCLERARSFLNQDGALVLAIENQLGLKYFNGCTDDHTGIPYFGVNGLYGEGDPVTFGRHALIVKLNQSGFPAHEFFYPFPDYKLPGLILTDAALRNSRLNVADLLIHNTGKSYPDTQQRAFAEDLAWRVALDNCLLPDLTNSFLVVAWSNETNHRRTDWVAKMYNRGRRHPCYQVESTIAPDESGALIVRKQKLFPDTLAPDGAWLRHEAADSVHHSGHLLVGRVHAAMAREADIEELAVCFAPWFRFMLAHVTEDESGAPVLPGHFVDCIPANLIETPSGEMHYIDAEWTNSSEIPLAWTVIRGVFNSLIDCLENRRVSDVTYRQLITRIAGRGGISLGEPDFSLAASLEQRLADQCLLASSERQALVEVLENRLHGLQRLSDHIPDLRQALAAHEFELARVKSTVSWQITKPLRFLAFLWRKLANWR